MDVPHRTRPARRAAGPRRRLLRRADGARGRELPDQRPPRARPISSPRRPRQESRGRGQRRPRPPRRRRSRAPSSRAADEVLAGALRDQFVVDVYQAGAGTSHNMNANEVLANRAAEILGEPRGTYARVHPNDHVNMGQSTNDVFPTATRLALLLGRGPARRARRATLAESLRAQGGRVRGRPQDRPHAPAGRRADHARPGVRRLRGLPRARRRRRRARPREQLQELNLGATAVGTGLNAGDDYRRLVDRATWRAIHGLPLDAGARTCSASRRAWATCSPIRARCGAWRSSSARSPATSGCSAWGRAPGSPRSRCRPSSRARRSCRARSIRRCPEMVNQVCFQVIGCDTTIAMACEAGQLELNVMMPVIAWNALHASTILREAMTALARRDASTASTRDAGARARTARSQHGDGHRASARTSATRPPRRSPRSRSRPGAAIRDLVLERGLLDAARSTRSSRPRR